MQNSSLIALLLVAVAFGGCASALLTVDVDVYEDDPLLQSLSDPDRLAAIRQATQQSDQVAGEIVKARTTAAGRYIKIYEGYLRAFIELNNMSGAAAPESQVKFLADESQKYLSELATRRKAVTAVAERALVSLNRFAETASQRLGDVGFNVTEFFNALDDLNDQLNALKLAFKHLNAANFGTHFEEVAAKIARDVPNDLAAVKTVKLGTAKAQAFMDACARLSALLRETADVIRKATSQASAQGARLDQAAEVLDEGVRSNDPRNIRKGMTDAMRVAVNTTKAPGFSDEGRQVLRQVGASYEFYTSQIDRIQDPADPAWRILSDPENQDKWHPHYAETRYYARGNASVVIVRDRLGHFRVQRATNNPTALIQGQLRVSRSIASGVLDVLASAAGVTGIPGVGGIAEKLKDAAKGSSGKTDPDADAKAEADVNARGRAAMRVRRGFLSELTSLRSDVAGVKTGSEVEPATFERLRAMLENYRPFFENAGK